MKKIIGSKKVKRFLFVLLIFTLLFIAACGKKECEVASDCASKSCQQATCTEENTCKYAPIANCCGNLKCDLQAQENSCNCAIDCKPACEGKVFLEKKGKIDVFAKYAEQACVGQNKAANCQISITNQYKTAQTVVSEKKLSDMKLEVSTTYTSAMDPSKDAVKIKVTLLDDSQNIIYPVKITGVKILSGQILLGQKQTNQELFSVGESIAELVKFSYQPSLLEEEKAISLKIDVEYSKKTSLGEDIQRISVEEKLTQKIAFVKTGAVVKK